MLVSYVHSLTSASSNANFGCWNRGTLWCVGRVAFNALCHVCHLCHLCHVTGAGGPRARRGTA